MTEISISEELASRVPGIQLLCIGCDVESGESPSELWERIELKSGEISNSLKLEEISSLPAIAASRKAYKACGKDPARYRLSAEALLRRIVKRESLYRIGNIVDIINLVSFSSGYSIGGYDASKIEGSVEFGIGRSGESYSGIGRGGLNIEGLPVFRDNQGAFGSPTSDSERTSVDRDTIRFLMVIIGFGPSAGFLETGEMAIQLLSEFAEAKNLEKKIIRNN